MWSVWSGGSRRGVGGQNQELGTCSIPLAGPTVLPLPAPTRAGFFFFFFSSCFWALNMPIATGVGKTQQVPWGGTKTKWSPLVWKVPEISSLQCDGHLKIIGSWRDLSRCPVIAWRVGRVSFFSLFWGFLLGFCFFPPLSSFLVSFQQLSHGATGATLAKGNSPPPPHPRPAEVPLWPVSTMGGGRSHSPASAHSGGTSAPAYPPRLSPKQWPWPVMGCTGALRSCMCIPVQPLRIATELSYWLV